MVELDPDVAAYYERGEEQARLDGGSPSGPLELERTKELLERFLPDPPARILDVGGGPGVYAAWLAELGHDIRLLDPIPLHVEQASAAHPAIHATVGDARQLPWDDNSADVVLLLGPLYHLVDAADRLTALKEAGRVVVSGGLVAVAAISRFAALLDMLVRLDMLHDPGVLPVVEQAVATGVFRGAEGGLFTNAYFHHADELLGEVAEAGLVDGQLFNVEGPGCLVTDFAARWADPGRRQAMMETARLVESEPSMAGVSSHLLAIARAPDGTP